MVPFVELVREKSLKRLRRKCFLPCVHERSTPCRQECLMLHESPELLEERQLPSLPVFTVVINLSAFARDIVKQSAE